MWDIGSGLSAFLGVVAGGAISIAGQWQARRAQVASEMLARCHQIEDRRVATHEEAAIAAYEFDEAARVLYDGQAPGDVNRQVREAYLAAWTELNRKQGPAMLAGPQAVSDALKEMSVAAGKYSYRLDAWLSGSRWTQADDELLKAFRKCRDAYEKTAQERLSLKD